MAGITSTDIQAAIRLTDSLLHQVSDYAVSGSHFKASYRSNFAGYAAHRFSASHHREVLEFVTF